MVQWQENEGCNNYCESSSTSCICCCRLSKQSNSVRDIWATQLVWVCSHPISLKHPPHQKNVLSRLTLLCERKNSLTLKIKYVFLYSWKYGWLEIKKVLNSCENKHKNGWEGSGISQGIVLFILTSYRVLVIHTYLILRVKIMPISFALIW